MRDTTFGESLRLLRTRRFGTFWLASFLSSIGTCAQMVAQPWLLLSLHASSFILGLDAFAMGAPVFLLTLWGGVLADHADRRRIIALFQSIQMLCPALIVVLLHLHAVQPWMIVSLSLVVGITDALSMPSFQTIVPSIVEPSRLPLGVALNSTQFNLSRIVGPAIAGLLMARVGAAGAFAVSAASYIPFILVALWILPRGEALSSLAGTMQHRRLAGGLREITGNRALRTPLLTVLATSLLCAPLVTFTPVLVKVAFHGEIGQFSAAMGAFGVGGLLGAIALLGIDPKSDWRPLSWGFAAAYGVIVLLTAVNPWLGALPALLAAAGIAMTASNASSNALLLTAAPVRVRGETIGLYMLAMRGGVAVGGLLTGLLVSAAGARIALFANGTLAILALAAIAHDARPAARGRSPGRGQKDASREAVPVQRGESVQTEPQKTLDAQ